MDPPPVTLLSARTSGELGSGMIGPVSMERGMIGRLPHLGVGSGAPMLFVGGLSPQTGVEAPGTERMNASLLVPFAQRRRVTFVNRRNGLPA